MSLTNEFNDVLKREQTAILPALFDISIEALVKEDKLLEDIPFISSAIKLANFASNISKIHGVKKLAKFIEGINNGSVTEKKRLEISNKFIEKEKYRQKEIEYLIILLDRYLEIDKATYLSKIYLAYLYEEITWDDLTKYAVIVDKLLICDFSYLIKQSTIPIENDNIPDSLLRLIALGLYYEEYNSSPFSFRSNGNMGITHGELSQVQKKRRSYRKTDFANGLKGEILFFQKKYDEAKTFFEMATKINQQNYKAQIFLADIATIKDDYKEAELYYKAVIEAEPKNINAIINYANMLYKSGNKALALEEYRKAILIDDKNFAALNNLGLIVKDEGDYQEALGLFFAAMNVDATNDDVAINALETLILYAEDNEGDARKIAQNWLKHYPNNVYAKHLVAAFEGGVDNDNLQYSQNLFNAFSDNYEGVLHKIGYRLPQKVKELFGQIEGRVLDIGCGTGLLGELIKNDCNTLVGIDLSEKMLNVARGKNCYDELVLIDGEQYLQKNTDFDYMFVLDVFCYVGDLSIFVNCMKNKTFFFSVERGEDKDFELQINGRYKHSAEYIKCLLSGIDYICEDIVLRVENGQEVAGMIFYKKTP